MRRHKVTRKTKSGKTITYYRGSGSGKPKAVKGKATKHPKRRVSEEEIERAVKKTEGDDYFVREGKPKSSKERSKAVKEAKKKEAPKSKKPRPYWHFGKQYVKVDGKKMLLKEYNKKNRKKGPVTYDYKGDKKLQNLLKKKKTLTGVMKGHRKAGTSPHHSKKAANDLISIRMTNKKIQERRAAIRKEAKGEI